MDRQFFIESAFCVLFPKAASEKSAIFIPEFSTQWYLKIYSKPVLSRAFSGVTGSLFPFVFIGFASRVFLYSESAYHQSQCSITIRLGHPRSQACDGGSLRGRRGHTWHRGSRNCGNHRRFQHHDNYCNHAGMAHGRSRNPPAPLMQVLKLQ